MRDEELRQKAEGRRQKAEGRRMKANRDLILASALRGSSLILHPSGAPSLIMPKA